MGFNTFMKIEMSWKTSMAVHQSWKEKPENIQLNACANEYKKRTNLSGIDKIGGERERDKVKIMRENPC